MEEIRSAIKLKEAIENTSKLTSIGNCPGDIFSKEIDACKWDEEYEWNEDNDNNDNDSKETMSERQKYYLKMTDGRVSKLKEASKTNFHHIFEPKPFNINIFDKYEKSCALEQSDMKLLYENAKDAGFGDMLKLETVVDKEVRDARHINDFDVGEEISKQIKQEWAKHLYPKKVKVKPYKINIYNEKGYFNEHVDTPEKNLIGTAIVSLWDKYISYIPTLKIRDKIGNEKIKWDPSELSCIMFYSDCPHKVKTKKGYKGEAYRTTLTFKIYSDEDEISDFKKEDEIKEDKINKTIEVLKVFEDSTPFGFLLGYNYSLETETLKGADLIIVEALKRMGKKITIIPVINKFYLYSYHQMDDTDECSSDVYPFTRDHIDFLLGKKDKQPKLPFKNVNFYSLKGGYVWSHNSQDYAEYTGNEAQPEEENSIYLYRAVIVV